MSLCTSVCIKGQARDCDVLLGVKKIEIVASRCAFECDCFERAL